jgi:hypothetical protein
MHALVSRWTGRGRGLTGFVVGVVATLTLVGGGVAIAAIPSTTTAKFNGCVSKDTGVLRVINYEAGKRCKKSEKGISWAQGWSYKGLWRSTTSYRPGDVVLDNGSSYVARSASIAKSPPSDASRWGLLASPGPQGATGARGPSDVFVAPDVTTQAWSASYATQRSLALPAGSYAVTATTVVDNNDMSGAVVDCRLLVGATQVDLAEGVRLAQSGNAGEASPVSLNGVGTLVAPGVAELQCKGTSSVGAVRAASLTAVQVSAVSVTP